MNFGKSSSDGGGAHTQVHNLRLYHNDAIKIGEGEYWKVHEPSNYHIDESGNNEFWADESFSKDPKFFPLSAFEDYQKRVSKHKKKATGRKLSSQTLLFVESVITVNSKTSVRDVVAVSKRIEQEYGLKPLHIALHKDEYYKDEENGEKKYNYHAHIIWSRYDERTAKVVELLNNKYDKANRARNTEFLARVQDICAEVLQSRGIDLKRGIRGSNAKHIPSSAFRKMKEEEKEISIQSKKLKELREDVHEYELDAEALKDYIQKEEKKIAEIPETEINALKTKLNEAEGRYNGILEFFALSFGVGFVKLYKTCLEYFTSAKEAITRTFGITTHGISRNESAGETYTAKDNELHVNGHNYKVWIEFKKSKESPAYKKELQKKMDEARDKRWGINRSKSQGPKL